MQTTHRIFISATSADLASYRQVIRDVLLTNGILPVEQTGFPPDFRSVESMLEGKIRDCDAVVCLVGFVFGAEPADHPADQPRRSFTQMEFDIARRLGKPVYQFLATEDCAFDSRPDEGAEREALQRAHRGAIESGSQLWERFSGHEQLRQRIAHIQFGTPVPGQVRPRNLPYPSLGKLFKGREVFLRTIRDHILAHAGTGNGSSATGISQRQALCGLGGVGKTRLAVEYGWRYNDEYSAVLFVVADSPENLRRNLAQLTGPLVLNLQEQNREEEEMKMAAAIRWLEEHPGWFLILDNVDNRPAAQAVEDLLARIPDGHVLITSRLGDWSKDVEPLELDVLSSEDAKCFLLERTQERRRMLPGDDSDAAVLGRELDGLALALEQAGAFIERQRCSLADYLKRWKAGESRVRQWFDPRLMHYPRSVAITYDTTMREVGPSAVALFRLLSWFAADPLPQGVLETATATEILTKLIQGPDAGDSQVYPEDAFAELAAFSMVKRTDVDGIPCFSQHRLVQELTQKNIPADNRKRINLAAVSMLMAFAPKDAYRPEVWKDWRSLIAHAEALWQSVKSFDRQDWNTSLMDALALYYLGQGRYDEAIPIQGDVLKLKEQRIGVTHPDTLLAKNDLALLLNCSGEKTEAQRLYREALAGWESIGVVEEEKGFTEALHNLGSSLMATGQLDEAEEKLRRALAIFERKSGEFHWRTLMTEFSLAQALLEKGEIDTAVSLVEQNIEKKAGHLEGGENHPDTLDSIQFLAELKMAQGEWSEAESLAKRAVAGREKSLGKDDRQTLHSLAILIAIYQETNQDVLAAGLQGQLIDSLLRSGNPDTLRNLNNQSHELRKQGFFEQVESIDRRVSATSARSLGDSHPLTIHRRNNLVLTLIMLGKLEEARRILEANWHLNAPPVRLAQDRPHANITPRIAFLRHVIALLESQPDTPFLGQLKTLLTGPELPVLSDIAVPWDVAYFIEFLNSKIEIQESKFLTALVAALNDRNQLSALDLFSEWRGQPPVPLDSPWP